MGLFGNDQEQDARLDAHEAYIRSLAEALQQNQLDVIKLGIALIRMEGIVNEKVNAADVDPAISALNQKLGVAREECERLEAAASDTWQTLHEGATTAVSSLRDSVEDARARIEQELKE